jgi:hypothetical protein
MSNTTKQFGVITACWSGDYFLAKATCASIRHFLGDVPICVIVDGNFSIQELIDLYNVQPLYLSNLSNLELRKRCPGSSRSKLAAIWEGPFEHFLYLDSDAIVWGNLLEEFKFDDVDFVVMRPPSYGSLPKSEVARWFFDVDQLLEIDPQFNWQDQPYFCAGAFVARKNCFSLNDYLKLEVLGENYPNLFKFWDQGIVNYMVFSGSQKNILKYKVLDLQVVTADYSKDYLEKLFPCSLNYLPQDPVLKTIIHFCGNKPFLHKRKSFSKPFTASRLLHYQNLQGNDLRGKLLAYLNVFSEEIDFLKSKLNSKIKRYITTASAISGQP